MISRNDEVGARLIQYLGYMAEVERDGFHKVMERAIAEALDGPEVVFISYDIDSLDPAYAPGTGTPEPGGPSRRSSWTSWTTLGCRSRATTRRSARSSRGARR